MSLPHLKRCGLLSFLDAQKAHPHTKVCGFRKLSDINTNIYRFISNNSVAGNCLLFNNILSEHDFWHHKIYKSALFEINMEEEHKNSGLLGEIWGFLKIRKKWWLLPIIIMLILVSVLIIFGSSSALSPFIYALG